MQRIVLMMALVLGLGGASSASACHVAERPLARRPVLAVASAPVRWLVSLRRDRECCRHRNATVRRRGWFGRDVTVERSIVVRRGVQ